MLLISGGTLEIIAVQAMRLRFKMSAKCEPEIFIIVLMEQIMVVKRVLYYMILGLSFFSCQNRDREKETFTFEEEKKTIDFSKEVLTPIISSFSLYNEDQKHYHIFIDENNNLIITDLQALKLLKVIPIQTGDGPNLVNRGLHKPIMIDSSLFLVHSYPNYYFINDKGFVEERISINNLLRKELRKRNIENPENIVLSQIRNYRNLTEKGKYIFSIKRMDPFQGETYPVAPLFAEITIDKERNIAIEILPLYFPEDFKSNNNFSYEFAENPLYTVSGDWLVYNYYFSSNVYFYNLNTGEKKSMSLKISTGENFSPDFNKGNIPTGFADILYDNKKKIIYRNHMIINDNDPMENLHYLTAYNLEGKLLSEFKIGSNKERLLRNCFIFEGKLHMNPFFPTSDEELSFVTFNLIKND